MCSHLLCNSLPGARFIAIWLVAAILAVSTVSARDNEKGDGDRSAQAVSGDRYPIGAASIDITPEEPVRLSGYGNRRTESEGIDDRLYAKAFAVGTDPPAILIAADSCILSLTLRDEIALRIEAAHCVPRDRVTIAVSHSHTTPMLRGTIPNLFGEEIPADHATRIDRYTELFIDRLIKVAGQALKNREPCRLSWGQGRIGFAANRRAKEGPTDHSVPVLCARRDDGRIKALVANYACHCTTLAGADNRVSPDWAGYASAALEAHHPGAVALVTIGCGGDQNPSPRTGLDLARKHGLALADEVNRVLVRPLTPVSGTLAIRYRVIALDLAEQKTAEQWRSFATQPGAIGRHASLQLARLERGERLATQVELPIQSWSWGDDLAMLFLGGEVVVDYALRLKQELDADRLWISAYSNAVPCYIPSERVLRQGGYEGAGAMVYYDQPGPFRTGVEQSLIDEVTRQVGATFNTAAASAPERDDLATAATVILDDAAPKERREEMIARHQKDSANLLARLTDDLVPGTPEELRRIPWIWRVAVAAGKRNDPPELASILDASLPDADEPLREWQAVAVGGGVINGIGLLKEWPSEHIAAILEDRPELRRRWDAALARSAAMADDEAVKPGTRYDALRMVALRDWREAKPILERYLAHKNGELQQGAVSGLADVRHEDAAKMLLESIPRLTGSNRAFALDALLRDTTRMRLTLNAIEAGGLTSETLGTERLRQLREAQDPEIRDRAAKLP